MNIFLCMQAPEISIKDDLYLHKKKIIHLNRLIMINSGSFASLIFSACQTTTILCCHCSTSLKTLKNEMVEDKLVQQKGDE